MSAEKSITKSEVIETINNAIENAKSIINKYYYSFYISEEESKMYHFVREVIDAMKITE